MKTLIIKFKRKYRKPNPDNRSWCSWLKLDTFSIEGDTLEDIINQAYDYPLPTDADEELQAIHAEGHINLGEDQHHRKVVDIRVFIDFTK